MPSIAYISRILPAYFGRGKSQLSFWHDVPAVHPNASAGRLGPYYMTFAQKADYDGPFDNDGIPLLDYRGRLGQQYNPIAVAQYGLANYNQFRSQQTQERRTRFLAAADWLMNRLVPNQHGVPVWNHEFDFEYRDLLRAPWYSGLAQGQGISLLVRAAEETGDKRYLEGARKAFLSFTRDVQDGGVLFRDSRGGTWIEEYIVSPPTHILNGFIWALWGVHDLVLATGDIHARGLFESCVRTLAHNMKTYDIGYWSLYEHSGTALKMMASPFYHRLHIVQLRVMSLLTGESVFEKFATRWAKYQERPINRARATLYKAIFKLWYY